MEFQADKIINCGKRWCCQCDGEELREEGRGGREQQSGGKHARREGPWVRVKERVGKSDEVLLAHWLIFTTMTIYTPRLEFMCPHAAC